MRQAIAEQVLAMHPKGGHAQWGHAYIDLVDELDADEVRPWMDERQAKDLGRYVGQVEAEREKRRRNERLMARGVAVGTGRPITPTLSVRTPRGTRLMLWTEASPAQFVEAVLREQNVTEGRLAANAVRLTLVQAIKGDDELMALPTLADVCERLGVDPDSLGLTDLERPA